MRAHCSTGPHGLAGPDAHRREGGMTDIRGGLEEDFETWVRPHLATMRRLAAVLTSLNDCDDVVQDALVRAWDHWSDFDPDCGSPRAWLVVLVADRSRALRRRRKPFHQLGDPATLELGSDVGDRDLRAAVARLPRRQREAILLFYYAALTVEEVAATMRISAATITSTLPDARKRLAQVLEDPDARIS